jgi:long-chain fatty acid transport protein
MSVARSFLCLSTALTALALPAVAQANGFYLQEQSVKGAGRAFSGEGADTGAESLWWNPAAIAGITRPSVSLGATAIIPKGDVRNVNTRIRRPGQAVSPVGGNQVSSDPIDSGVAPNGAVAVPLTDRLAIGLAVTSPFSFTTNYEADSWARYTADKTSLRTIDIQPSVALAVTDWLRVGGALNVEYSDATLSNALPNLSPLLADGRQTLKGDGWDLGWTAGAQMHNDIVTVGFSYKSSVKHKLAGDIVISGLLGPLAAQNREVKATATLNTPWQAIMSARVAATDRLTLNGQIVRFGWGEFDAIRLGAPLNTAIPENYRNTWTFATGVDYAASPKWTLRAGVQHAQTPTRNGERDARVPDSNRWIYAAGTSYQLTPGLAIDLAASYVDFAKTTIDRTTAAYAGTQAQTPILVSGQLNNARAIVLGVGGRLTF